MSYSSLEVPQSLPQIRELRRRAEIVVQILHHDARKVDILDAYQTISIRAVVTTTINSESTSPTSSFSKQSASVR